MRRFLIAIGLLLLLAPAADASTRGKIIRDCSDDGVLQGSYSTSEIRDARKNLPSDVAEYTDCADVLRRAEQGDKPASGTEGTTIDPGTGTPSTPSGGSPAPAPTPPLQPETDEDRAALVESRSAPETPVTVGGESLLAGASPLRDGYRANALPGSLIVALILLGLAGLALSVPPVRRRAIPWLQRRR